MSKTSKELSHHSLDEFEEIERLIRENTAVDSDEEEQDTLSDDFTAPKQLVESETNAQGDTGYQSVARFTNGQEIPISQGFDDGLFVSDSNSSTTSSSSSLLRTHLALGPESPREREDVTDKSLSVSDRSFAFDPNLTVPENHSPAEPYDTENGDRLVATFGTTENFEVLLKQQLDNTGENGSENDFAERSDAERSLSVSERASPVPTPTVQLPSQWKSLRNRTTRSPAANRARKASKTKSRSSKSHSPGLPESSDDLSVHSDASRHELRQRLRKSRSERNKEQNITQQLQTDYDDLLTRFAEAENVIDQLRIGARIDLFAQLPSGVGAEEPGNMVGSRAPSLGPQSTPRPSQDNITENSLKLPAAASTEFNRIALVHRANELKDHIGAFEELLKEGHVEENEKRQVLDNIVAALNQLQSDYVSAGQEHDAENRALVLSGNASGMGMEDFDSDHKIKEEVFKLGKMVENLKEKVHFGSSLPQTPTSSRKLQSSQEWPDSDESSNSTLNIEDDFNEQLRRYNKAPIDGGAEGHTTASSHFTSSDEDTVGYVDDTLTRKTSASNTSNIIPERFLRPQSASSMSPPKSVTRPASSDGSSPARSSYSPLKADSSYSPPPEQSESRHRPKSRLPRPVGPRSHSTPVAPLTRKNPSSTHEMDGDSGFIGSESSRQSATTAPLMYDPRLQKLSPVRSVPYTEPVRPMQAHSRPLKPVARHAKTSTSKPAFTKRRTLDHQTSSDTMLPGAEAPTYTPTKQTFKNRSLRSDDGSTGSFGPKSMPAFARESFPHGASGGTLFSSPPFQLGSYHHAPSPAERVRPSSRRSAASSSKDSTLDLLRGEIAKLRQELKENVALAAAPPKHVTRPGPSRAANESAKAGRGYTSDSQATESPSARGRRVTRLKDRRRLSKQNSDRGSVDSAREITKKKTIKRDAKTGSDTPLTAEASTENTHADSNVLQGHWEYIPPYFSPPTVASVRHVPVPAAYPSVQVQPPVLQMEPTYYSPVRCPSPARIYIPVSPSVPATSFRSIPVQTEMYQRRGSIRVARAATQTSIRSNEKDEVLTRSQLASSKRSSSVPPIRHSIYNPELSVSLERAERAANSLRKKSRAMNRSLRDSFNRAQLSSTLA